MTFVLGLTGSIGMGKSTTSGFFRDAGIPVWDADAAVHALYAPGGAAVVPLGALCPAAVVDGGIERAALKDWIACDPSALKQIETVVHPLVARDREQFIAHHRTEKTPLLVLDVPLLFESGADRLCDAVLVVSADPAVQRSRVMARPGMTEAHFNALLAKQMPDARKRALADHLIITESLEQTARDVKALISKLTAG